MSRSRKRQGYGTTRPKESPRPVKDSTFTNIFARLGMGQMNLTQTEEYPLERMTQNYGLLNSLYRGNWIARRIIDTVPEDMCKNWFEITSQVTPDQNDAFNNAVRKLHIKSQIIEGLRWGRLFGGAAGIMIIDGQQDMLDEPLDLDSIMPGQFKGLIIADRWNGVYPDSNLVQDLDDPDFGTPEYYTFSMAETDLAYGIRVHHSRVIRFTGRDLPYVERMSENWWGMSELEHVYTELKKRDSASENIANLIYQANLRIYKMSDLGQTLAATDVQTQRDLYNTLMMQNFLMSNMSLNVMDKEDSMEQQQYNFAGLNDLYELFMLDISGAAEIPATKLYGRSPAGLNATGEGDLKNYYDKIRQDQESNLRPILEKLLPVLCVSVWGTVPDDLDFEFNPVRDTSEEERAGLIQQSATAIVSVFQAGLISQKTALKELRQSGAIYAMWSNITDEDIDKASDDVEPDETELGTLSPIGGDEDEQTEPGAPTGGKDEPLEPDEDGDGRSDEDGAERRPSGPEARHRDGWWPWKRKLRA